MSLKIKIYHVLLDCVDIDEADLASKGLRADFNAQLGGASEHVISCLTQEPLHTFITEYSLNDPEEIPDRIASIEETEVELA